MKPEKRERIFSVIASFLQKGERLTIRRLMSEAGCGQATIVEARREWESLSADELLSYGVELKKPKFNGPADEVWCRSVAEAMRQIKALLKTDGLTLKRYISLVNNQHAASHNAALKKKVKAQAEEIKILKRSVRELRQENQRIQTAK